MESSCFQAPCSNAPDAAEALRDGTLLLREDKVVRLVVLKVDFRGKCGGQLDLHACRGCAAVTPTNAVDVLSEATSGWGCAF